MRDIIFNEFVEDVSDSLSKKIYENKQEASNPVFLETAILTCILKTSKKIKEKIINDPHYGVKKEDVNQLVIDIATEVHQRLVDHFSL
ncbi:MAG TPA: hypothetical protein PLJ19_01245 [Dysgonamonadaceae bacterium]|nr:hypothetical protein [Dysgonamonadaceae bacterium]